MNNILIIFGATGDLMDKKISPALFGLNTEKPDVFQKIIGFGRRDLSNDDFRMMVKESIAKKIDFDEQTINKFLEKVEYHQGEFHDVESFAKLNKNIERDYQQALKHIYLAIPPELFPLVINNLGASGFIDPETKIMVEKPIGNDLKSSQETESLFSKYFIEPQIYRIDHYLGKDSVQNILSFRFANSLFDPIWNSEHIERIEIRVHETIGVENRGSLYDKLGTLRDFGQNHILQLLALTTMDEPEILCCEKIRMSRAKILQMLKPLTKQNVKEDTFRAQYQGYKEIKDVDINSKTETYFKLKCFIDSDRWRGVPIYLESGKKMDTVIKEIEIYFKGINKVIFSLEPEDSIKIFVKTKKPGITFENEDNMITLNMKEPEMDSQYIAEYSQLFHDFFMGDQTFFIAREESENMWKFVQPILDAWKDDEVPLDIYKPNSSEAKDLAHKKLNI